MAKNEETKKPAIKRKLAGPTKAHKFTDGPAVGTIVREPGLVKSRFGDRVTICLDTCTVYLPPRYQVSVAELSVGESIMVEKVMGPTSFDTIYEISLL